MIMNRYAFCLLLALFVAALICSCDEKTPVPEHPTAITLSADELVFTTADAASLPLTVTAPSQPTFSDLPDWLSVWRA